MTAAEKLHDSYSTVTLTTDASGDVTGYATVTGGGLIEKVHVEIDDWTSGAADVALTCDTTGESILSLTDITTDSLDYPTRAVDDTSGSARAAYARFFVPERVKIVIADGGDSKAGKVTVAWSRS